MRPALGETGSARIRGWLAGGATVLVWLVVASAVRVGPPGTVRDLLHLGIPVLLCSSIGVGVRAYGRALPSAGTIVWLRRFHRDRSRGFGALLERAARGVGYPVTLHDSSYAHSYSAATSRAGAAVVVLVLALVPAGVGLAMLVGWAFGWTDLAAVLSIAALVLLLAGWVRLVRAAVRRLGFRSLGATRAISHLDAVAARGRDGRRGAGLGVDVVRVPDDDWQAVVTHALSVAAMAVVDVTDPSDRIRWEVGVALRTVGAHRLVFAVETAAPAGEVVEQVWRDVVLPVRDGLPLDREWLASVLFCYPPQRPRPASPDFRRLVASLRSLVLLRLAAGPAVALTAGPGRSLPSRG